MNRAQQRLKIFTLDVKNEYNKDYRNLTNFMDIGETFCVVKDLNDKININFVSIFKNGYSAVDMQIKVITVFAFVTIRTTVLNKVYIVDVIEYVNLRLRRRNPMK